MHFDWSTLALQTVNFAILVWLLHRFLYRPVLRLLDARRAEIDKQYAEAHMAEANAKDELAAIEAERAGIAAERSAALEQASAQTAEAAEARRAALDLGTDIAGKLLAEVPMKLRAEAWLARLEEHLAALPQTERDALAKQLVDGAQLTVVTASELPVETAEAWRARLHRALGDQAAIGFGTDRQLVAGAELHFPNAVLSFSWQSALAAMREEIASDDDAR